MQKSIYPPESVAEIGERAFGCYTMGYHSDIDRMEDLKIYGKKDTAAEKYAVENGFEFIEWDGIIIPPNDDIIVETTCGEILYLPEPILKGDATGDGLIDVRDVASISKYLIKMIDFTEQELANADVTKDNIVNINDLMQLKRFLIHDISVL